MGGLGCLASPVCLSGLLLGSKHSAQALANWRFRPVQKGLRGGLIESIDVSLRGVVGWGREIMSMCTRSQKSACVAADCGRPSCRTRCLEDASSHTPGWSGTNTGTLYSLRTHFMTTGKSLAQSGTVRAFED